MKKLTKELKRRIESGCERFGYNVKYQENDTVNQFSTWKKDVSNYDLPEIEWFHPSFEDCFTIIFDPRIRLTSNSKNIDDMFKYIELCGKITGWIESIKIIYDGIEE